MSPRGGPTRRRGAALVDVLAAMLIAAVAAGLTSASAQVAARSLSLAWQVEVATTLATARVEELRAGRKPAAGEEIVAAAGGSATFSRRWTATVKPAGLAIEVEVSWQCRGRHRVRLATLAPLP